VAALSAEDNRQLIGLPYRCSSLLADVLFQRKTHPVKSRAAYYDQENIENEESDGNVVKKDRLAPFRPELIGGPENKRSSQHDRLYPFPKRSPM
jgi:hypothetical protein